MNNFIVKDFCGNIESELENIGFDNSYIFKAKEKFIYKTLKVFDVTSTQANIIKQIALSVGAECATNKGVITGMAEKSNCLLTGTVSQLRIISAKLKLQPFGLKILGESIEDVLNSNLKPFKVKDFIFDYSRPYIVGVLNLGKSFTDGHEDFEDATNHLMTMISDGADIIDIGAESTKPGSNAVCDEVQIEKILPVLQFVKQNNINIPISIDTRSSNVAKICLENGADIINDVSGFDYDDKMADIVAKYNCPVVIQHSSATPDVMQQNTDYENLVDDIYKSLYKKVELAKLKGIKNIIIDLGIGFGKTREQNFELLRRFEEFYTLNTPVMLGLSRKSLLNMPEADNFTKDIYTLALDSILMSKRVNFVRVHNVSMHKKLLDFKILE